MVTLIPAIVLWWSFHEAFSSPLMGPADIVFKFSEKCDYTLPTFIDFTLRLVQRRGKPVMNATATLPFKFSDKMGFEVNIAVKRNGVWKPNFFKTQGGKVCSGVKIIQKEIFEEIAKDLKAPPPYNCPLPAGSYAVIDYHPDVSSFQAVVGNTLPYGEYRADLNMTHKTDQISCQSFYIDIVPKSTKKKGR